MIAVHNWLFSLAFSRFFFFKQKTAYEVRISDGSSDVCSFRSLAPSVAGARIGAVAITEEASGAPLADILTTAAPQPGGGYLLRGSKAFVSLAGAADFYQIGSASCRARGCQYV